MTELQELSLRLTVYCLLIIILTFSMESVDQVGRRERFMQSNFESLSGGDDTSLPASMSNSISNAWREGGAAAGTSTSAHQRNAETIGETSSFFPLMMR